MRNRFSALGATAILFCLTSLANAQLNNGSDGSDGVFNPTTNVTIDLNLAPTVPWNTPGNGNGVYDPIKWAVVFKFQSVNIPAGVTVKFLNNRTNAPVMWLVQGNVVINGTVNLNGSTSRGSALSIPGPGGFAGGSSALPAGYSYGFGPGAAATLIGSNPRYGTAGHGSEGFPDGKTYNNARILPLIGGSGGSNGNDGAGAGGGAILIASNAEIQINGSVYANGSYYYASGGAIRLIGERLTGSGVLQALPHVTGGGVGRIRLEFNDTAHSMGIAPAPSVEMPGNDAVIFPPAGHPEIMITSINGIAAPSDPTGNLDGFTDVNVDSTGSVPVVINAANVPLDWTVYVRMTPRFGNVVEVPAVFVSGNETGSIWRADVTLPRGALALQARAVKPGS